MFARATICYVARERGNDALADEPDIVAMGEGGGDFRNLVVWRRAHQLTLEIYRITASFPREERYALSAQLRSASSSVPMNLAEGCSGEARGLFALSVDHALRSAGEVDYQLILAHDLGYLNGRQYDRLGPEISRIRRMLAKLRRAIRRGGPGPG